MPSRAVMFRGTVEVRGLDNDQPVQAAPGGSTWCSGPARRGPALGRISLAPGQERQVQVRLIYPPTPRRPRC